EAHPPESVGYVAHLATIKVRDGAEISVRISHPTSGRLQEKGVTSPLPVLFVTHGGGCLQGTHLSEEAWLYWHLYEDFELVIVSVEYRLAPEHKFPVWIEDSWDVLETLLSSKKSVFSDLDVEMDIKKVLLAGSSSGAGISAVLSQMCRDKGILLSGIILNVPVVCDYRHFPAQHKSEGQISSYRQAVETFGSGAMVMVWNVTQPSELSGLDSKVSPLLGDLSNLPRHLVFVAGQDALRDEGVAYATKLRENGVEVELKVFSGVPHHFAQISELKATARFQKILRETLARWL
ncbi:alpha/beta hydrolase fold-domain-containing protein, partial [Rhexocercosporidium sp. MPI-PUGE-AT-0058]